MANPNIGSITCHLCGAPADVRRYNTRTAKLYYSCAHCGQIRPGLAGGQTIIRRDATLWETGERPEPAAPAPGGREQEPAGEDSGWFL